MGVDDRSTIGRLPMVRGRVRGQLGQQLTRVGPVHERNTEEQVSLGPIGQRGERSRARDRRSVVLRDHQRPSTHFISRT